MTAEVELEVPDGTDLTTLLGARLGAERRERVVLLDTFDGRLRAAGLAAEHIGGALTLIEEGRPPRRADVAAAPRLLAEELPAGPVRDRLAGVLEERALLPLATVTRRRREVPVLDRDEKTVVRVIVETVDGIGTRLRVRPVRGYEREHASVLRELAGLSPAGEPVFDLAVRAAGLDPAGTSSKPGVKLERGMRADAAAGLVLARLADVAQANVPGTLEDLDPEFLHDLRVAVRRARSVLRELRGVHPSEPWSHLRDELRWVQQVTGPVRDLDVQLLDWPELTAAVPAERAADLEPLRALLVRRRAEEIVALRRALRSRRFARALGAWRALAATPPTEGLDPDRPRAGAPIDAVAADRIRQVHRRMIRDGRAITDATEPEALHDLRKRGKELRYLLELFGNLFPKEVVKPLVAALKDLQTVLGRFQDRAVQADLLRELGDDLAREEGGPAALMALGLLVSALEADQREARAQFAERFAAFAEPAQRALVKRTFDSLPKA